MTRTTRMLLINPHRIVQKSNIRRLLLSRALQQQQLPPIFTRVMVHNWKTSEIIRLDEYMRIKTKLFQVGEKPEV